MTDEIRVFCGATREHWLPAKVLEHSILRRTKRPIRFRTLDTVQIGYPLPRDPSQRPVTSFSFQRFLIPEACSFQGRGIYLDSDQIVMADIAGLWETPIPAGASCINTGGWQTAVLLIDNTCGWKIVEFVANLDSGRWKYGRMMNCQYPEMGMHIGGLDPLWNVIDRPDPKAMDAQRAKLLHYTDMRLQPWLYDGHPKGAYWNTELREAVAASFITVDDVLREIHQQNVRPSLALVVDEEPPYEDARFVFPDQRRKGAA
jgi:hypothetical protein